MNPTLLARQRVICDSESSPRSWPCTITSPLVARSSPAIRFKSVVLPEPEGPIERQELALADGNIEVDQNRNPELVAAVFLVDTAQDDRGHFGHGP